MCIAIGTGFQSVACGDHLRRIVCGGTDIGELAFGRHVDDVVNYLRVVGCLPWAEQGVKLQK